MSLEKSIEQFKHSYGVCPFAKLVNNLNDEDRKALLKAIENKVPDITLASALRKEGWRIAEVSIAQHRKGICRCPNKK